MLLIFGDHWSIRAKRFGERKRIAAINLTGRSVFLFEESLDEYGSGYEWWMGGCWCLEVVCEINQQT